MVVAASDRWGTTVSGCGLDDPVMPPPRWLVALRAWLRDKFREDIARTLWPVSIGDYDHRVVAICESADEAQRFCDHLNGEKGSIHSDDYVVDEPIQLRSNGDPLPEKVSVWTCTVYDDDRPPSIRGYVKWPHDVHAGGSRFYNGGIGRDWPTPEEAERHARAWRAVR